MNELKLHATMNVFKKDIKAPPTKKHKNSYITGYYLHNIFKL